MRKKEKMGETRQKEKVFVLLLLLLRLLRLRLLLQQELHRVLAKAGLYGLQNLMQDTARKVTKPLTRRETRDLPWL